MRFLFCVYGGKIKMLEVKKEKGDLIFVKFFLDIGWWMNIVEVDGKVNRLIGKFF